MRLEGESQYSRRKRRFGTWRERRHRTYDGVHSGNDDDDDEGICADVTALRKTSSWCNKRVCCIRMLLLATCITLVVVFVHDAIHHDHGKNQFQIDNNNDNPIDNAVSVDEEVVGTTEEDVEEKEEILKEEEEALEEEVEIEEALDEKEEEASEPKEEEPKHHGSTDPSKSMRDIQIENYKSGESLILSLEPIHTGDEVLCRRFGQRGVNGGIAPSRHCYRDDSKVMPPPECKSGDEYCHTFQEMMGKYRPWNKDETGPFIDAIRPYFHFLSWHVSKPSRWAPQRTPQHTDWEHPNLVSVIVTRDPLERMLSGDGDIGGKYPGIYDGTLSREGWFDYALYHNHVQTDNFFLRILDDIPEPLSKDEQEALKKWNAEHPRNNHITSETELTTQELMEMFPTGLDETNLNKAKSLLDRFTFVLDYACLEQGMYEMGQQLGMNMPPAKPSKKPKAPEKTPREKIHYADVYAFLVERNKLDTELYKYSKTISLVKCE